MIDTPDKIEQEQANYRIATGGDSCATCENFVAPDSCQVVAGLIKANGLCDVFSPSGGDFDALQGLGGLGGY